MHKITKNHKQPHSPLLISPETPWLAPLAGYSDLPFRLLCREFGASVCETEMVSAKGLVYDSPGTKPLLKTCPEDSPLVVQIFGSEPEFIARAMDMLLEMGYRHFDLNSGCPVAKVAKTQSGAAMLKNPDSVVEIARVMINKAGPGNVGVKIRSGWNNDSICYLDLGQRLEDIGVSWLTLHPRTAKQGYSGEANWTHLKHLREAVSVPVIASGDLFSAEDAVHCIEQTGVSGVMFARGALSNPAIFSDFDALLAGSPRPSTGGPFLAAMIRRHIELINEYGDERRDVLKMRTILPRYVKNIPGSKALRVKIITCRTWDELAPVIDEIENLGA